MSSTEDLGQEVVTISSLEHYSYCPRQYALINKEQTFEDNIYTLRGKAAHQRVDEPETTQEDGVRVERSLPLWSVRLGLIGKADVVEFHGAIPYPIEYKYGRRKPDRHADLQLCAQAICLEEMLGVPIPKGAVFHVSSHQRREVEFTLSLRQGVTEVLEGIRRINAQDSLPTPVADARCPPCSLVDACMPWVGASPLRVKAQLRKVFELEDVHG